MSSPGDTTEKTDGKVGSAAAQTNMRLVLVGLTGAGKSSSANTILGRRAFRVGKSATSVTKECSKQTDSVAGREITVVDTPGLFDTGIKDETLEHTISKCLNMTAPGPHAILLVIKLGPFDKDERLLVKKIRVIFGEEAHKHTIVLFTHGDKLSKSIAERVNEASADLKDVVGRCGNRYHVFNNKQMEDRDQVMDLLDKVDALVAANGGRFYTSENYKGVEDELKQHEKKKREEFDKELEKIKADLQSRFSDEQQKLDERFNEFKRYYDTKIREAKLEAEQSNIQTNKIQKIFRKLQNLTLQSSSD